MNMKHWFMHHQWLHIQALQGKNKTNKPKFSHLHAGKDLKQDQ